MLLYFCQILHDCHILSVNVFSMPTFPLLKHACVVFSQGEDSVGYQGLPSAQFFASPRGKYEKKKIVCIMVG